MSDSKPALSLRYYLNLEESQDGFALATFGKKQLSRFLTPLVSIGIVIWGFYLGFAGMGKYYVESVSNSDYSMVLGMTVFYGIFLVFCNLVVDVLYGVADPRVRIGKK